MLICYLPPITGTGGNSIEHTSIFRGSDDFFVALLDSVSAKITCTWPGRRSVCGTCSFLRKAYQKSDRVCRFSKKYFATGYSTFIAVKYYRGACPNPSGFTNHLLDQFRFTT